MGDRTAAALALDSAAEAAALAEVPRGRVESVVTDPGRNGAGAFAAHLQTLAPALARPGLTTTEARARRERARDELRRCGQDPEDEPPLPQALRAGGGDLGPARATPAPIGNGAPRLAHRIATAGRVRPR